MPERAEGEKSDSTPTWLLATSDDFSTVEFEEPISGCSIANCDELSRLFRAAAGDQSTLTNTSSQRVFLMLSSIMDMHFKPEEKNEPFGPVAVFADGRRSAIPSDFRSKVDLLAAAAPRIRNPVLRARLSDLSCLLDRKQSQLAFLAISSYVEIIEKIDGGELKWNYATEDSALQHDTRDILRRSLQICRMVGWEKQESIKARDIAEILRKRALEKHALIPASWFSKLSLDFGISNPIDIGDSLKALVVAAAPESDVHNVSDVWCLAARAYHIGKDDKRKNECLSQAAEALVLESDRQQGSVMLAAHLLSSAIAQLHGVPGKKDRRIELRHKLLDIQANMSEEMSVFSQEINLQKIIENIQSKAENISLLDKLFLFSSLAKSPDPNDLVSSAQESIRKHPLSSLFGSSHIDSEGKVIYRTEGADLGDSTNSSAIIHQIMKEEDIRRKLIAFGEMETARRVIVERHYISDDTITPLLSYSPFVPNDLVGTFSNGYVRFFQGDFMSALYILTPLLENSLRHVLKSHGHDVTIFDDTDQTQQDRTISSLFEQMRDALNAILTPAIVTDIERLFLMKPGPHLRHALAHGLLHDGTPYGSDAIYACGLIFRLCLLPLYPHYGALKERFGDTELAQV